MNNAEKKKLYKNLLARCKVGLLKEICPRGNNKVIIYFLIIMINVYYSC